MYLRIMYTRTTTSALILKKKKNKYETFHKLDPITFLMERKQLYKQSKEIFSKNKDRKYCFEHINAV